MPKASDPLLSNNKRPRNPSPIPGWSYVCAYCGTAVQKVAERSDRTDERGEPVLRVRTLDIATNEPHDCAEARAALLRRSEMRRPPLTVETEAERTTHTLADLTRVVSDTQDQLAALTMLVRDIEYPDPSARTPARRPPPPPPPPQDDEPEVEIPEAGHEI